MELLKASALALFRRGLLGWSPFQQCLLVIQTMMILKLMRFRQASFLLRWNASLRNSRLTLHVQDTSGDSQVSFHLQSSSHQNLNPNRMSTVDSYFNLCLSDRLFLYLPVGLVGNSSWSLLSRFGFGLFCRNSESQTDLRTKSFDP